MSTIAPGRLKNVTNAADLAALCQFNFEAITADWYLAGPTPVNGVPTTTIGPPTVGAHLKDELWTDALRARWICITAGTPGTWRQLWPAIVAADPSTGTIPNGYRIWRSDQNYVEKFHAGAYAWTETYVSAGGNLTINDSLASPDDTGTISQLLSWIGVIIRGITGKGSWRDAPRTTLENTVKLNGDTMTGDLAIQGRLTAQQFTNEQAVLSYAASVALNFNTYTAKTISLTGNITFTTSNCEGGKMIKLRIECDGTNRNLTWPSGWKWLNAAAPTAIAADKTAILTIECWGPDNEDIIAAYAVEP